MSEKFNLETLDKMVVEMNNKPIYPKKWAFFFGPSLYKTAIKMYPGLKDLIYKEKRMKV